MGDRMEEIVLVTMSEFGRTAQENGNNGTDHGHGNLMFVLGGPVGEEGFGKAAKAVHDDSLRTRFVGIARQRSDFADELARHVTKLGGSPAESGHQSGIQHSGWRELEERIRPRDAYSFLAECERGEENTLRHYEHALTEELPAEVGPVVERQKLAVQEAL